jgi:phosphotransferase system enzyme I (PtsI)
MHTIYGKGVCGGIAFGKLSQISKANDVVKKYHVDDINAEKVRLDYAFSRADAELRDLYKKALSEVGEDNASIFEIHRMMLKDDDFLNSIYSAVKDQHINAEAAVAIAEDNFSEIFSSMDDSYMKERAADVHDISKRLIKILTGRKNVTEDSGQSSVIAAMDLSPSETVQLDRNSIVAFVTEKGSTSSHTAILARTLNIPAVINASGITDETYKNSDVIVDGFSGTIYINPDMVTVLKMQKRKEETDKHNEMLHELRGIRPETIDGKSILLYANIGNINDLNLAFKNGAQGVGLFRSEFIYLERDSFPSEEKQFSIYKKAAEKMCGKRIIIRTLDIGADKKAGYFNLPDEGNPAMGLRAIRICLKNPDIFITQLRALYRAGLYGNISIMFPMITSLKEMEKIKELSERAKWELKKECVPFKDNMETGIMIETPAAALISDKLAKEVDFFSIGTNDLTQYSLAIDRENETLVDFVDTHHLAILRMIKFVTDNAHKNGKWVGICGELASDTELTEVFLAMGVDELSVTPGAILGLKEKIINTDMSKTKNRLLEQIKL